MSETDEKGLKQTLSEDDIESSESRTVGRRGVVGLLGAGAAGAVALATGCGARRARVVTIQATTGITDNDQPGCPNSDPAGNGRGNSGITDGDGGACADPAGRGRGAVVQQQYVVQPQVGTGITDSDPAGCPTSDPAGNGRGNTGLTDSDGGPCADGAGRGRRGY